MTDHPLPSPVEIVMHAVADALPAVAEAAADMTVLTAALRQEADVREGRTQQLLWEAAQLRNIARSLDEGAISVEVAQSQLEELI